MQENNIQYQYGVSNSDWQVKQTMVITHEKKENECNRIQRAERRKNDLDDYASNATNNSRKSPLVSPRTRVTRS